MFKVERPKLKLDSGVPLRELPTPSFFTWCTDSPAYSPLYLKLGVDSFVNVDSGGPLMHQSAFGTEAKAHPREVIVKVVG